MDKSLFKDDYKTCVGKKQQQINIKYYFFLFLQIKRSCKKEHTCSQRIKNDRTWIK